MRIFGLGFALVIGAAPLLQGCGDAREVQAGVQPALAASTRQSATTAAHFLHSGSWMAGKTSSSDLIYMVLGNTVGIYNFSGDQVGALKGFEGVAGLCSDTQGNVWVTYGNSLLEYTHAGTVPIAQVYLPSGYGAESCAVDPGSGNLAVTERSGEGAGNVAVYQNIYYAPTTYTDSDLEYYAYCTYDGQGDLFVNGTRGKKIVLAELPHDSAALGTVDVNQKLEQLGGLEWDGQYLALGDSLAHVVYQLAVVKGQATVKTTTHFKGWYGRIKTVEPFAIQNGIIVLTFSKRQTGFWKFPAGGPSTHRISVITGAKTISVAPSALRGDR